MGKRDARLSLERDTVFLLLFSLFVTAYVAAPYWTVPPAGSLRMGLAAGTLAAAAIWAWLARGKVEISVSRGDFELLPPLLLAAVAMNWRPLNAVLPWRGDEDYHIGVSRFIVDQMGFRLFLLFLLLALCVTVARRRPALGAGLCGLTALSIGAYAYTQAVHPPVLLRYPFASRFLHALGPAAAGLFEVRHLEAAYRIVPFLSALALAWLCGRALSPGARWQRFLFSLAVLSMPLVYYYSSIYYLEMPALLLMVVVSLGIEGLLEGDYRSLRQNPAWYALLGIGFVKETTVPFLLSVALCRLANRVRVPGDPSGSASGFRCRGFVRDELKVLAVMFLPLSLYFGCRALFFHGSREYTLQIGNLADGALYGTLALSFIEQFGALLVLSAAGCVVLLLRKRYAALCFILCAVAATALFHLADRREFVGYSRFNLFLLAPLLLAAVECLRTARARKAAHLILPAVVISNVLLSPVNIDGTRKPFWGSYLSDTAEHYFPYREAIDWIAAHHEEEQILFIVEGYPYYLPFYFDRHERPPEYRQLLWKEGGGVGAMLQGGFAEARRMGYQVVVFPVPEGGDPYPGETELFVLEKTFRSRAHGVAVYTVKAGPR